MNFKDVKINFLGDSITYGSGASSPDKCFVSLIGERTGATVRNYGIGGARIAKQIKITNPDYDYAEFCNRYKTMDDDADIIAVFGGTNDFGHGDACFGEFSDRDENSFYGALHLLLYGLIEKYPDKKIFLMTPLHRMTELNPRIDGHILHDFVKAEREVAEYYSIPVLDLYSCAGIQPMIRAQKTAFTADGLHPNDEGHSRIADLIIKFIENSL